jgi:hypothetical protein
MTKRIIVLPDIHTPNHSQPAISAIFQFIKYYKPTQLVQLGDFCDWDSLSSYDVTREKDITPLTDEISAACQLLDKIDAVLPKGCKKLMTGGNHEARYEKFRINKGATPEYRRLRKLTSWAEEYELPNRGWDWCEYGEWRSIGKIIFTHGWYTGNSAAKKMAEQFPGKNVLFGHTHQHLLYGWMDQNCLPIESESIGTLSNFNLSYLNGKRPTNWVHSFMYIDMLESGKFSKHFVNIIDNQFIEHGKTFRPI